MYLNAYPSSTGIKVKLTAVGDLTSQTSKAGNAYMRQAVRVKDLSREVYFHIYIHF